MGCWEEADLGGVGLVAGGDPSEKISLRPLRPLCYVAGVKRGELPCELPSLPTLWERENVDLYIL
jgi:hypothetical protein